MTNRAPVSVSVSVSVVMCAYTEQRWADLERAVEGLASQTRRADETVLVIDHCPPLFERAKRAFPDMTVVENSGEQGLSDARNTGVEHSRSEIVAFVDEDAVASPDWIEQMARTFDDDVIGAGGSIDPEWMGGQPFWFPDEFRWVVGCSYIGMPTTRAEVRNLIGCNMAVRRSVLADIGGFRIGRVGQLSIGRENDETDLFIRAAEAHPDGRIVYDPAIRVVDHRVPASRSTIGYFMKRCYSEGLSKARLSNHSGHDAALSTERAYASRVLPRGVVTGFTDAFRGRPAGLARSVAILVGTAATGIGFLLGTVGRLR